MTAVPVAVSAAVQHYALLSKLEGILAFLVVTDSTATYVQVAKSLGMFSGGKLFAELLGETQVADHQAGRPFRSSLVCGSETGIPGHGYFNHLRSLGYKIPQTPFDELVFWVEQMGALNVTLSDAAVKTATAVKTPVQP
jgi:hypothetical protein